MKSDAKISLPSRTYIPRVEIAGRINLPLNVPGSGELLPSHSIRERSLFHYDTSFEKIRFIDLLPAIFSLKVSPTQISLNFIVFALPSSRIALRDVIDVFCNLFSFQVIAMCVAGIGGLS